MRIFGEVSASQVKPRPPLDEPGWELFPRVAPAWVSCLSAVGLHAGDTVIVPAIHDPAAIEALVSMGGAPRVYDLDAALRPEPASVERTVAGGVRAMLVVHQWGFPAGAPAWRRWCDARGLLLLEDATLAWATTDQGTPAGASGHAAVLGLRPPDGRKLPVVARARPQGSAPRPPSSSQDPLVVLAGVDRLDREAAARRRVAAALMTAAQGLVLEGLPPVERGACPLAVPVRTVVAEPGAVERASSAWPPAHHAATRDMPGAAALRRLSALPVGRRVSVARLEGIGRRAGNLAPLTVERISALDDVREDWSRLAEAAGSPFATWEWARAWWDAFGGGSELLIHVARRPDGEIAAILPLYVAVSRGPVRVVRFIGHGPGDQLGPVCSAGDRLAAARALRAVVRDVIGAGGVLLAERLPAHEGWAPMLGSKVLRRDSTPLLAIDGQDWDGWLASKSRNFREQVRRRERKLRREHDVSLRLLEAPDDDLESGFDTLVDLHEARWAGGSRAFRGPLLDFHRYFLRRAAQRGWARIWLADIDGRPGAAWYGFRFGAADWYYQAGRDPSLEQANVGFILLSHTIRDAFAAGRSEYRFLLGDESYKSRFTTDDPGLDTLAVSFGPAAGVAAAAAGAVRLAPKSVRSRVESRLR